jgi:hypothetical protein
MKNRLGPNASGANGTCMTYSAASISRSGRNGVGRLGG